MNAHDDEPRMRELDQRRSDDMVVTLLWSERTGSVYVSVEDRPTGVEFHFAVDPVDALDAFRHPYVYRGKPRERAAAAA